MTTLLAILAPLLLLGITYRIGYLNGEYAMHRAYEALFQSAYGPIRVLSQRVVSKWQ